MQKPTCSRCVFFFKNNAQAYCFRVDQLGPDEPIKTPRYWRGENNETECPHYLNGNKVRARYAENRVKLENLIELSQEPERLPYGKRGIDGELLRLERKVMCDHLTLEKVSKAQASILEGK